MRSSVAWTRDDRLVLTIGLPHTTTLGIYHPGERQVSMHMRAKSPPQASIGVTWCPLGVVTKRQPSLRGGADAWRRREALGGVVDRLGVILKQF
jgi:hypothetical protein